MTGATLRDTVLTRLGDDPNATPSNTHYLPQEVMVALNQVQRIFVLFTLCLETTVSFPVTANTPRYQMLKTLSDWLVPLRIRTSGGVKVRPERVSGLAALDVSWPSQSGPIVKYAHSGFDLLSLYKNQVDTLSITYARSPVDLTPTGTPEIQERYHPLLIDGAIPLLRTKEGQQEWQKSLPLWDRFMDGIKECADKVRARNRELAYDAFPPELKRYDLSRKAS
jgi:hypothetical protein